MLLPTLTVRWGRRKDVMSGAAASTHLPHAQTNHWTLCPRWGSRSPQSIVVPCQRLRAGRTGAQFQHDGKTARDLSIVLQKGKGVERKLRA